MSMNINISVNKYINIDIFVYKFNINGFKSKLDHRCDFVVMFPCLNEINLSKDTHIT